MFRTKFVFFMALCVSVFSFCYVESQEVSGDVMPSPTVCLNCTICQYPCHPLPPPAPPSASSGYPSYGVPPPIPPSPPSGYPLYGVPPPSLPSPPLPSLQSPPPPPPAEVSQGNCPPIPVVQCCNYPPPTPYGGYVPPHEDSAASIHLSYVSAKVFTVLLCCFVLGVHSQHV